MISSFFKWPLFTRVPAGNVTADQITTVLNTYVDRATQKPLFEYEGRANNNTLTKDTSLAMGGGVNCLKFSSSTIDHDKSLALDVIGLKMKRLSTGPATPVILYGGFTIAGSTGYKYIAGPTTTQSEVFVEVTIDYVSKVVTIYYDDIQVYQNSHSGGNMIVFLGSTSMVNDTAGTQISKWYDSTLAGGDVSTYLDCYHAIDFKGDLNPTGRVGPCSVENVAYGATPALGCDAPLTIENSSLTDKGTIASLPHELGDAGAVNYLQSGLRTSYAFGYLSPDQTGKAFDSTLEIVAVGAAGTVKRGIPEQASMIDIEFRKDKGTAIADKISFPCLGTPTGFPMMVCDMLSVGAPMIGDGTKTQIRDNFDIGFKTGKVL